MKRAIIKTCFLCVLLWWESRIRHHYDHHTEKKMPKDQDHEAKGKSEGAKHTKLSTLPDLFTMLDQIGGVRGGVGWAALSL